MNRYDEAMRDWAVHINSVDSIEDSIGFLSVRRNGSSSFEVPYSERFDNYFYSHMIGWEAVISADEIRTMWKIILSFAFLVGE